jgi:hypothetical protein
MWRELEFLCRIEVFTKILDGVTLRWRVKCIVLYLVIILARMQKQHICEIRANSGRSSEDYSWNGISFL